MQIESRIYDLFQRRASETRIRFLSIGLGYTAVVLEDDSIGIGYTWIEEKTSCSLFEDPEDYEGKPALALLEKLFAADLLSRSVAVAAVNALNHPSCARLSSDSGTLLDDLGIVEGNRLSMIGYFGPIAKQLQERGVALNVFDLGKGMGSSEEFYANLEQGTDAVIVSSTSIIHGSTEELLSHVGGSVPCALVGPTTPMIPEVFAHLPITILAGTCPEDVDRVLKAVRHARGTKAIHRASRKVYWKRSDSVS